MVDEDSDVELVRRDDSVRPENLYALNNAI